MTDDPLHDVNNALAEIEKISVQTDQGSFIRVDDLKKLLTERAEARLESRIEEIERGRIRTPEQARAAARRDTALQEHFAGRPPTAGRSVAAGPE